MDFIKLYLDDISLINNLTTNENLILKEIFKIAQDNNLVILNKYYRNEIAGKLNIKDQTIKNSIVKFKKIKLLKQKDVSIYYLNLNGLKVKDLKESSGIKMIIEYENKKRKIKTELKK